MKSKSAVGALTLWPKRHIFPSVVRVRGGFRVSFTFLNGLPFGFYCNSVVLAEQSGPTHLERGPVTYCSGKRLVVLA